jgi:diazepam-binding inhibitor (GABA receptor modulator, acyl-CoA-binding protein)
MTDNALIPAQDADLTTAQAQVKTLTERPSNAHLLKLYALYKQATQGACTTPAPGGFDFVAIAKHEAWSNLGAMSPASAKAAYIALVAELTA